MSKQTAENLTLEITVDHKLRCAKMLSTFSHLNALKENRDILTQ